MGLDKHKIINSKYLHKIFYKNLIFCYISKSNEKDLVVMLTKTQYIPKNLCKEKDNYCTSNRFTTFVVFNVYNMYFLSITYNSHWTTSSLNNTKM